MELQRATPPPYTTAHSPGDLGRPPAPPDDLVRMRMQAVVTLPHLATVLSPEFQQSSPQIAPGSPASNRSLPRIEPHGQVNGARRSIDTAIASPSEVGSAMSMDEAIKKSTSVSMDDPDIRVAAEALAGLGNPEFARSPPNGHFHVPSHAEPSAQPSAYHTQEEEPMLQLLTQAHPYIGGTISGSLYAYSTTKSLTPQFVQASANMLERSIATPIISTVGSVGRMTGADRAARWYLTPRAAGDVEHADEESGRSKRRRLEDGMDMESGITSPRGVARRDSQDSRSESLPAYRSSKPPSYREEASPAATERSRHERPSHNRTWSQQLVLSASGLGVAMSETSRRSLVFCLNFLGRSAEHIATVMNALKLVLEQYDQARDHFHQTRDMSMEKGERPRTPDHDEAARRLAGIIKKHCDDIWQTLKTVVHSVSTTAGGALPSNAREFVRNQLMSLPRRWQMVSNRQLGEGETSRNAHRMIAFATEGLDMIAHVTHACNATLQSAEGWVQVVGRRQPVGETPGGYSGYEGDHEMSNGDDAYHAHHDEKQ